MDGMAMPDRNLSDYFQSVVQHRETLTTSDVRASFSRVELHFVSIASGICWCKQRKGVCPEVLGSRKNKHGSRDFRALRESAAIEGI